MKRFLVVALLIGLSVLAISTVGFAQIGSISVQWGDPPAPSPPPPPPPGPVYHNHGGPPPHAPAHGYRAKHQYRYYPYQNVYYEPARGAYFYMSGDGWSFGASLPAHLTVASLGTYVSIGLDTEHPYYYNHDHVRMLMIGAIEPLRDRRNEASGGSPKSSHPVIAEMRPPDDRRNRAS